jgi:glycosyl transferase, family 25
MDARLPEILVISLAGADARRRLMQAQLSAPGIPSYRFVDAVDGAQLSQGELAGLYDAEAARQIHGELTRPEIGCAASHLAAYRYIVAHQIGLAVVLEDDALLGLKFPAVLAALLTSLDAGEPRAVLLAHVVRYSAWGARRLDKVHRLCTPYEAYGAHAYMVTRAGAQAMLAALPRVRTAADNWGYFASERILKLSAVIPYVVGTSPISLSSQIGAQRYARARGSPVQRWLKKHIWQKLVFQLLVKPALRLHRVEQTW